MWKCKECEQVFKKKNKMKLHIETHHSKPSKHILKEEQVEIMVDDPSAFYTGETEQNEKYRIEISKRIKEFTDPEKGKMWKCIECDKIHKKKFKLECHVESHLKQLGLFFFPCINCDKICKTKESLKQHINIHHKDENQ